MSGRRPSLLAQPVACAVSLALTAVLSPTPVEANWTEFRGDSQQGIAVTSSRPPVEWSRNKNIAWRTPIPGKGWSSPVVSGERIYLTTAVAEGLDQDAPPSVPRSLRAMALDAQSGDVLWEREVFRHGGSDAPRIHQKNSHASPTPVVIDGNRLIVHFGYQGTACLDLDGQVVWRSRDLAFRPIHGNGGSPTVWKDRVIFGADGVADPFVAALHLDDGRVLWKTPRRTAAPRKFSFSTPRILELPSGPEAVLPGSGNLFAYDPRSGEELWRVGWGNGYSVVPRPVFGHGLVFASSGYDRAKLYAVRPGGRGDVTESHVVWTHDRAVPKNASFLLVGDHLYTVADNGITTCLDARTGDVLWQERLLSDTSASPIHAGGHLYAIDETGTCIVLRPGEQAEVVSTNEIGERTLASMAVTGNALLLRTEAALYRIKENPGSPAP